MLTENEFLIYKLDTPIYKKQTTTDEYGGEQYTYQDEPAGSIRALWQPMTSEAAIAQYGERVNRMLQAVIYNDPDIEEYDKVIIRGEPYIIRAVIPLNTHSVVRAEKYGDSE